LCLVFCIVLDLSVETFSAIVINCSVSIPVSRVIMQADMSLTARVNLS